MLEKKHQRQNRAKYEDDLDLVVSFIEKTIDATKYIWTYEDNAIFFKYEPQLLHIANKAQYDILSLGLELLGIRVYIESSVFFNDENFPICVLMHKQVRLQFDVSEVCGITPIIVCRKELFY